MQQLEWCKISKPTWNGSFWTKTLSASSSVNLWLLWCPFRISAFVHTYKTGENEWASMQTLNWIWIEQHFWSSRLQAHLHIPLITQSHQQISGLGYSWGSTLNEHLRFPIAPCSYFTCKAHFLKWQIWRHKDQFKAKLILKCQPDHLLAFTQISYPALQLHSGCLYQGVFL